MNIAVGRTLVLVLLLVCVPLTAAGGTVTAAQDRGADAGEGTFERVALQQETPDADNGTEGNETVRHRNPDEYDENADEEELERWLSDWMSGQLEGGAIELSEGEYELASEYVDEEYRDRLGQFVEVTGDAEQAESFEEAQREQAELTDAVAEYEATREEYEAAREAGDEERARELARELESLAEEIGDSNRDVQRHYETISEDGDVDLSDAAAEIEAVNEEVQTEQEAIREAEFVETELTVEAATEEISFTEPMVASGTLVDEDGTAVANEEIRLDVGNQTLRTETDATGSFEFEYRPISVPLSADSVTVEYVPENQSAYLGDETDVPVDIEQVEPSVTVAGVEPGTAAYGDELTVDAEVAVDGEAAAVPLRVSIDGTALGVLGPDEATLDGNATVPADVPAGDRELTVSLPFEDRALANAEGSTAITVAETEPDLSISADRTGDREVTVNGTLAAAGDGVEGQSVRIVADGATLETMTTDADGAFGGTVSVPEETATGDVQLVAVHDDEGSNLARTEAAATVSFPGGDSLVPTWAWLALGLLVAAVGAGVYWYRRDETSPAPIDRDGVADEPSVTADAPDPEASRTLLSRASDRLATGDADDAVRDAYAAVRSALESSRAADSMTHWEFYRRYRDRTADGDAASLLDVTEGYERATFDPDGVSEGEAEAILERARELCSTPAPTASADD